MELHIRYDEYEFLEIFESEPEDFLMPGSEVYKDRKVDNSGFE